MGDRCALRLWRDALYDFTRYKQGDTLYVVTKTHLHRFNKTTLAKVGSVGLSGPMQAIVNDHFIVPLVGSSHILFRRDDAEGTVYDRLIIATGALDTPIDVWPAKPDMQAITYDVSVDEFVSIGSRSVGSDVEYEIVLVNKATGAVTSLFSGLALEWSDEWFLLGDLMPPVFNGAHSTIAFPVAKIGGELVVGAHAGAGMGSSAGVYDISGVGILPDSWMDLAWQLCPSGHGDHIYSPGGLETALFGGSGPVIRRSKITPDPGGLYWLNSDLAYATIVADNPGMFPEDTPDFRGAACDRGASEVFLCNEEVIVGTNPEVVCIDADTMLVKRVSAAPGYESRCVAIALSWS